MKERGEREREREGERERERQRERARERARERERESERARDIDLPTNRYVRSAPHKRTVSMSEGFTLGRPLAGTAPRRTASPGL
mgnify:CR=1 FL=1